MPMETPSRVIQLDNKALSTREAQLGSREIHSWGMVKPPGMAAVSAITTLQIGALYP